MLRLYGNKGKYNHLHGKWEKKTIFWKCYESASVEVEWNVTSKMLQVCGNRGSSNLRKCTGSISMENFLRTLGFNVLGVLQLHTCTAFVAQVTELKLTLSHQNWNQQTPVRRDATHRRWSVMCDGCRVSRFAAAAEKKSQPLESFTLGHGVTGSMSLVLHCHRFHYWIPSLKATHSLKAAFSHIHFFMFMRKTLGEESFAKHAIWVNSAWLLHYFLSCLIWNTFIHTIIAINLRILSFESWSCQ